MKKIWDRDTTKQKDTAYRELLYVYYLCDFKSPYASYPEDERLAKVNEDVMSPTYKADKELSALIAEYKSHQEKSMPSLRLLNAARDSVHKLANWLNNVDYEKDDPAKVAKTLGDVGKIIDSLNKLEEKVKKEITTSSRIRGGGSTGLFED